MYKLNQDKIPLLEAMKNYALKEVTSFDVPGHKRGVGTPILNEYFGEKIMSIDTNSLPILDHIGKPTGVIKEAQDLLADAFNADEAFFVSNGSTAAIQMMLMSVLSPGEKVLMPKNIHKSALNGLILAGGIPIYLSPEVCDKEGLVKNVTVAEVKRCLDEFPEAKVVFLLNPTYFGYVGQLREIIKLCKQRNVLTIVDEAHGAHFNFHKDLPPSAMECGADMSAVSIHKTGGALTQASVLLVKKDRIDLNRVKQVVNILQSTSVSYLLMGSLDGARYNLVKNGKEMLENAIRLCLMARNAINEIPGLSTAFEADKFDPTKLVINTSNLTLTGFEVYELLWQQYNIQLELCETDHVLAIVSLGDTQGNIDKLIDALKNVAKKYLCTKTEEKLILDPLISSTTVCMSPRDAYYSKSKMVEIDKAAGYVSAESIMAYPPGIPIISPGELITAPIVRILKDLKAKNAFIVDNKDPELQYISVVVKE